MYYYSFTVDGFHVKPTHASEPMHYPIASHDRGGMYPLAAGSGVSRNGRSEISLDLSSPKRPQSRLCFRSVIHVPELLHKSSRPRRLCHAV